MALTKSLVEDGCAAVPDDRPDPGLSPSSFPTDPGADAQGGPAWCVLGVCVVEAGADTAVVTAGVQEDPCGLTGSSVLAGAVDGAGEEGGW